MAAYALGQENEKIGNIKNAIKYYEQVEYLFPLPNFKSMVKLSLDRLRSEKEEVEGTKEEISNELTKIKLEELDPQKTLFIVSCSKKKIWNITPNAQDFIPARYAYKGEKFFNFLRWVEGMRIEEKGFFWIILSGKYGFIECWHPISRYDVNLGDENTGPISDKSLQNQVKQKRWWRDVDGNLKEICLADFSNLICINCNEIYLEKIENCFSNSRIQKILT